MTPDRLKRENDADINDNRLLPEIRYRVFVDLLMILYGAEIEYVHVQKNLKGGFNEKFLKQCTKLDPSKRRCNTFSLNAYLLTSYIV